MKKMKTKITVAITGLNNTDNPGPGVPVIRGIRESENLNPVSSAWLMKTWNRPSTWTGWWIKPTRFHIHQKDRMCW